MRRQVILDTETTGLDVSEGERIIDIGCIELIGGREGESYQTYVNPKREISAEAQAVHGHSAESLSQAPEFSQIADKVIAFIKDAELVAHNAPFDTGFLDAELERAGRSERVESLCPVVHDTLVMARQRFPGAPASLDALCRRYEIDLSERKIHGALLDAKLLLSVWLRMCGQQSSLDFSSDAHGATTVMEDAQMAMTAHKSAPIVVRTATEEELRAHHAYLEQDGDACVWKRLDTA